MNISKPASASGAPDSLHDEAALPDASSTRYSVAHGKTMVLLTLSALAIGQANSFRAGWLDYQPMCLLASSLIFCALGLFFLRHDAPPSTDGLGARLTATLLQIAPSLKKLTILHPLLLLFWLLLVLWQVLNLIISFHGGITQVKVTSVVPLIALGVCAVGGIVWSLRSPLGWWLQLAAFVGLGWWFISRQQVNYMDVYIFQNDSCAALLRGVNPYTITFPNPYYAELHGDISPYYGAGLSVNGRLQFGYVYMPLTLLLTLPGYLLGDSRLSQVFAIAIAAWLMVGSRPRGEKALLGALFLWMPMVFYVVFLSWTDPFCVLTLSFVLFCTRQKKAWLPVACGLFLVSKQYTLLALPFLWLLAPITATNYVGGATSSTRLSAKEHRALFWPFLAKTLAVAAIVTLPLALWNFKAFFWSTMLLQFHQPYRPDSLSFMALWSNLGWGLWPSWVPFVVTMLALVWALRRAPRDEIGFFTSVSLVFLVFFAFNKQAFVNYYYFAVGALWCATMAAFDRNQQSQCQVEKGETASLL